MTTPTATVTEWPPCGRDDEAIQVYVDELLERGHPGGRYAVALRTLERFGPRADLLETVRCLEEEHPREVLGHGRGRPPEIEWRSGVWHSIRVTDADACLADLLDHPLARFVEEVQLDAVGDDRPDFSPLMAEMLAGPPRPRIKSFSIRAGRLQVPHHFASTLPSLEHLELAVSEVGLAEDALQGLLQLQSLFVTRYQPELLPETSLEDGFPALATLRIDGRSDAPFPVERLRALLDGRAAPRLRALWLHGLDRAAANDAALTLSRSPLLRGLKLVSMGKGTAEDGAALKASARSVGNDLLTVLGFSYQRPEPRARTSLGYETAAEEIVVLEGLLPVRYRPRMYLTGRSIEAGLCSSLGEMVASACQGNALSHLALEVEARRYVVRMPLRPEGTLELEAGRILEAANTMVHAPNIVIGNPPVSLGNAVVVNALCEDCAFALADNRRALRQSFRYGQPASPLESVPLSRAHEALFEFHLDPTIVGNFEFDTGAIAQNLRELTYLVPGSSISLRQPATGEQVVFSSNGLPDFIAALQRGRTSLHTAVTSLREHDGMRIDLAFQWSDSSDRGLLLSFVNARPTSKHGDHLTGMVEGLLDGLREAGLSLPSLATPAELERVLHGAVVIVHAKLDAPTFDSPDRSALLDPAFGALARTAAREAFRSFVRDDPRAAEQVLRAVSAA